MSVGFWEWCFVGMHVRVWCFCTTQAGHLCANNGKASLVGRKGACERLSQQETTGPRARADVTECHVCVSCPQREHRRANVCVSARERKRERASERAKDLGGGP